MSPARTQGSLRRFGRSTIEPRLRLVCLPHAGGVSGAYRTWRERLAADIDVVAVQYPGRQDRLGEDCVNRMEPLVDLLAEELAPLTDLPTALFGHSMGASVAHEVALRLIERGTPPMALFVSGRPAPHLLKERDITAGGDEAIMADVLSRSTESAQVLADPDMRELVLPAIRADYQLVDAYRPGAMAPIDVPIAAYVGDDDQHATVDSVREWAQLTEQSFELRVFPGGHFYLTEHEAELAGDIGTRLAKLSC